MKSARKCRMHSRDGADGRLKNGDVESTRVFGLFESVDEWGELWAGNFQNIAFSVLNTLYVNFKR